MLRKKERLKMKNIPLLIIAVPFYVLLYIGVFLMKSDADLARESYEVRI